MSGLGKRFITEKDAEARKKAQEAEGVVEEPYDARSLYDRLQIEKDRKQEEYEAQSALKNRIHRLDKEEVEYLQSLAMKQQKEQMHNEEEVAALVREAQVARPSVQHHHTPIDLAPKPIHPASHHRNEPTQRSLLAHVLKRPSQHSDLVPHSKPKRPNAEQSTADSSNGADSPPTGTAIEHSDNSNVYASNVPVLTNYSDSDRSSSSDSDSTDVELAACTLVEIAATRMRKRTPTEVEDN